MRFNLTLFVATLPVVTAYALRSQRLLEASGGPCDVDEQCKSGLCAALSFSESSPLSRTTSKICVEQLNLFEPCERDQECRSGACDALCLQANGAFCDTHSDCISVRCSLSTGDEDDICMDRLGDGSDCQVDEDCISEHCGGDNKCAGVLVTLFSACTSDMQCSLGACKHEICLKPLGSVCDSHAECASERCALSYELQDVCQEQLTNGSDCNSDKDCLSNFCSEDRKCVHGLLPLYSACKTDGECSLGTCKDNFCLKPVETQCDDHSECASGRCALAVGAQDENICQQKLQNGFSCRVNEDCRSDLCSTFSHCMPSSLHIFESSSSDGNDESEDPFTGAAQRETLSNKRRIWASSLVAATFTGFIVFRYARRLGSGRVLVAPTMRPEWESEVSNQRSSGVPNFIVDSS